MKREGMGRQNCSHLDPHWLDLFEGAEEWFQGPLGQLLLSRQQAVLEEELQRLFGGYLVHYSAVPGPAVKAAHIQRSVRIGAPLAGVEIACEEQSWPLGEHAADAVVLQHGLDFCLSPHGLLREAAFSVRPGGHLLIVGFNPWSLWGMRHWLSRDTWRQARCIDPGRVSDWLHLLGFALEKRRFGCYRPPLCNSTWQARLQPLENRAEAWQLPGAGFYVLVARKLMVGLRPLRPPRREPRGQLLPMPVAKISRRDSES